MEEKMIMMEDLDLQARCHAAGKVYLDKMYPGVDDVEKKAIITNACAAGYSKGYRDREAEIEKEKYGDDEELGGTV